MIDWSRLPDHLREKIAEATESLTAELPPEQTFRLRVRIKAWKEILEFGKDEDE